MNFDGVRFVKCFLCIGLCIRTWAGLRRVDRLSRRSAILEREILFNLGLHGPGSSGWGFDKGLNGGTGLLHSSLAEVLQNLGALLLD